MSKYLEGLNKNQRKAAEIITGPLAIIAGAGSGKTKTITHKIAHLIESEGFDPSRILAVTFTNKAAKEMKERISKMIGKKAEKISLSTYHSLGARFLRREIEILGYKSNFNILDNIDQKMILSPLYKKHGLSSKTYPYSSVTSYISKSKILGNTPDVEINNARSDGEKVLADIYKGYVEQLEKIKAVDFDDLLLLSHKILSENEEIAEKWSNKYDYVLVDEFQDTSWVQYELINMIAKHQNITIVGDPDQTIYTWRQADVNLINNFKNNYKKAKVVKLEENYRSTKTILDKANTLIKHNTHRIDKNLKTTKGEGDIVEFNHAFSDDAEARWIVQKINQLRKDRTQLKDIAILYRANYLSAPVEKALINEGINYAIFGGVKFYQRQEIKDAISFLKIIATGDEISMRRMINVPSRKIGKVAQEKLFTFAEEKGMRLYDALMKHINTAPVSLTVKKSLVIFLNLINKYKKALETNSIALVLSKFLKEIDYYSVWNKTTEPARIENLLELIRTIDSWEKQHKDKGIIEYLEEISLFTDKSDFTFASDYVSLMTVHAAKGLEFDSVFILGFSDGVFPSKRAMDEGGSEALEEERRLAYVAITRAKERLYISDARGYSIDYTTQKRPSRFLKEMGINIRDFTSEFIAPQSADENYMEDRNWLEGDTISHIRFGEGVIVSMQGDIVEIAFKDPHGVKSLMKNHKSLERVG